MATKQDEIRTRVCLEHKTHWQETLDPSWKWNPVLLLPAEDCQVEGCTRKAPWVAVGLRFPDGVGSVERVSESCRANYEVFMEARQLLGRGNSQEALTDYLTSRVPKTLRRRLFHKFASLILREMGIDAKMGLNDRQKHDLVKYLEIYPEETA